MLWFEWSQHAAKLISDRFLGPFGLVLMHSGRSESEFAELEKVPEEARTPQHHLARALTINALQRRDEATFELNCGGLSGAGSPELTLEAARLLISHHRKGGGPATVGTVRRRGRRSVGTSLAATRAWCADAAFVLIRGIQSSRPEWGKPNVMEGIVLDPSGAIEKAIDALQMAMPWGQKADRISERIVRLCHADENASRSPESGKKAARQRLVGEMDSS